MNYIIRTQKLCKQYKETTALNNVSLHIPQGSIYGLIGNNGVGKTTIMRILSGIQTPTFGKVIKPGNFKIGAIIESPALYPTLSARGNLKYQLTISGYPKKLIKRKTKELLSLVHLKGKRKIIRRIALP